MSKSRLQRPSKWVSSAVLKLVEAQQAGSSATLPLGEVGALLTHLRSALELALAPTREELRTRDRQLLWEAMRAFQHVKSCGACGDDAWSACAGGGQHAERTLAALELALVLPQSVDADEMNAAIQRPPASLSEKNDDEKTEWSQW